MPPNADLPGFLHGVAPILDRWGYTAVGVFIGVESFGVPAPGQTIMVAAAIYAGAGRLNIVGVAVIAFLAAVLGDNIGYWIGVRGGRKAVHRWGKYVFLTPERLTRAEGFFARRGGRIVVIARFIDGLRQFNGVIAGITAMPWRTFLLYNTIGALLWVGWWTTVAFTLGTHLVDIIEHAHRYKWWAIAGVTLAIAAYVTLHLRHVRGRRARTAAAANADPGDAEPPTPAPEPALDVTSQSPPATAPATDAAPPATAPPTDAAPPATAPATDAAPPSPPANGRNSDQETPSPLPTNGPKSDNEKRKNQDPAGRTRAVRFTRE